MRAAASGDDLNLALEFLQYRLYSVELGRSALAHAMQWDTPPGMEIYFDGKLAFDGRATGFTNGAIESAMISARALLEFFGMREAKGKLAAINANRRGDDLGIEMFPPATRVSPADAVALYKGPAQEAEVGLAFIAHAVNKLMAHPTRGLLFSPTTLQEIDVGLRGITAIALVRFYGALGIQPPPLGPTPRTRPAGSAGGREG